MAKKTTTTKTASTKVRKSKEQRTLERAAKWEKMSDAKKLSTILRRIEQASTGKAPSADRKKKLEGLLEKAEARVVTLKAKIAGTGAAGGTSVEDLRAQAKALFTKLGL